MARWVRLQLANGVFEGRGIVSAEVLAFTRTPKVASSREGFLCVWLDGGRKQPNGTAIFHTGSTLGFGTLVGLLPDKDVGVVVLSNEED